ncbi:hypothetical protein TNCV_2495851 [Trichonephila clavipes]|nr:hypothetical protein TNCV_2495851 [Trichonephila clavipes]
MHQVTCESSPRLEWGGPLTKYVIGPVQHVIGPPACHWTCVKTILSSMSLDPSSMSLDLSKHFILLDLSSMSFYLFSMSLDLFSMSLDPVLKLFLGDLFHWTCPAFIGPVQHFIFPVQHVIGPPLDPRVKTIFGRPLFHWTCPAFHLWMTPVSIVALGWNETFSLAPC